MMSLWDILNSDIQRYIHLLALVSVARDKWRGYMYSVTNDVLNLIYSTRTDIWLYTGNNNISSIAGTIWDIELYGYEGLHTLNVIKFFKKHNYLFFETWLNEIWMAWLNSLSFSLWHNEYNGHWDSRIYNLIEENSKEFFENKHWHIAQDAIFLHLEPNFDILDN